MDIVKAPIEQQRQWLQQRGWEAHPDRLNVFIDPNTRINCFLPIALERALADCRVASDFQLNPVTPRRKDDSPPPTRTG